MRSSVERFAEAAIEYCDWAEANGSEPLAEAQTARRLLPVLCALAVDLPETFSEIEAPEISKEAYDRVFRRFGALPFNYYSECFNPLVVPGEQPVTADLADDLADIWRDLKPGVLLFRAHQIEGASWQWRFHFHIHWGHHATGALYALHAWFTNESEVPTGNESSEGGLSNSG